MKATQTKLLEGENREARLNEAPPKFRQSGLRPVPRYAVRIRSTYVRLTRAGAPIANAN